MQRSVQSTLPAVILVASVLVAADAQSTTLTQNFLPIVLAVLGLAAAIATAVGGYYALKAARHKAGDQEKALTNLIDALTDANREKDELRDRVIKQAAHIEIADQQLSNAQEESKQLRERVFYLEKQEEKWQARVEQLEGLWQDRLTKLERHLPEDTGDPPSGPPLPSS